MVRVFGMSNHRVMARGAGGFAMQRRVVLKRAYRSSITGLWLRFSGWRLIDFPCVV
jgi:hypothetical protein